MAEVVELLTVPEVAAELRSSETNVYRLIQNGSMPHTIIGKRRYLITRAQLDAYLVSRTVDPAELEATAARIRAERDAIACAGVTPSEQPVTPAHRAPR